MRIEKVEKEVKKVDFESLNVGDCYLDSSNKLCMKIDTVYAEYDSIYDCIYLEDGSLSTDWGDVIPVELTAQYHVK